MTYPYGVHLAQVELDPGTGGIEVLRYFVADEVGRAINPATVEGQLVGGALQGIGGALFEELAYSLFIRGMVASRENPGPVRVMAGRSRCRAGAGVAGMRRARVDAGCP
jgi:xanthine dehydrogenase molybdopterin-binding subunit B